METGHFPFLVTIVAVSCLTDVLCLHAALKISNAGTCFYGKALAQVLATIQIFQSQNMLNYTALHVHWSPEVENPTPACLFLFYSHSPATELGLYLNSWGLAFHKDLVPA